MHEFQHVVDVGDVPDPGKTLVELEGEMVALFHVAGAWHAIDDVCTHDGGPLADGELRDHSIACPRHGAKFDIRTGAALTMPAVRATRAHDVEVRDGGVWIRLQDAAGRKASSPVTAAMPATDPTRIGTCGATTIGEHAATAPTGPLCEDAVREVLKEVKDPELFVNIVDLGLIYGVTIGPAADDPAKHHVSVDMTMTSPACPAGPQLIADTKRALARRADVAHVEVRIVMDPPWTPDRMTEAARDQLGIF